MVALPYLTSSDLIETVKLNISFPISQNTFSDDDILKFANHELFMTQVPSVLQYHEDYFSFREVVPLKANKNRYDIPYRAIGNKLYAVYFQDQNSRNLRPLAMVDAGDKAYFQSGESSVIAQFQGEPTPNVPITDIGYTTSLLRFFYIESNQIVLSANIGNSINGSLVFVYYLRPNNLVIDSRASICTGFTKDITVDNTTLVAGDSLTIDSKTLVAGTDFEIGATSSVTASNVSSVINSWDDYSCTNVNNLLTIAYEQLQTPIFTSNTAAFAIESLQAVTFDQIPANITNSSIIDFIKKKGAHRTYKFDYKLGKNAISANTVRFNFWDVPTDFEIGDYIATQFECIIPQIPSDLHSLLAERTCARILESLGDQAGLMMANQKIKELENGQSSMIKDRVEGSPRKVFNRNNLLRCAKGIGYGYGRTKV
jgi:hypothetical protein